MSAVASKLVGESGKGAFKHIFLQMNAGDRKLIRYWNVDSDEQHTKVRLYTSLVGQGFVEYITSLADRMRGDFRMYPDNSLICVELVLPSKTV